MQLGSRYRRLWVASAAANVGDGIAATAVPLLAATLSRDPLAVAGISTALYLPWLLFALPGGALVDRVDRRLAMAAAGAFRAAVVAVLAVAVAAGTVPLAAVYVVVFVLGTAETVYESAARALLPALVPAGQLDRANGRLTVAEVAGQSFVGPPLAGALFGLAVALPFTVTGVALAAAAALAGTLPGRYRPDHGDARPGLRSEIAEGLRWLAGHRLLRGLALISGLLALATAGQNAVAVLYALEVLHLDEQAFGLLIAAGAAGAIAGGATASRVADRLGGGRSLTVAMGVGAAGYAALALTRSAIVAGALFAACGWSVMVWNVRSMSLRHELVPERLFGRVLGAWRVLVWGVVPLGAALGGLVARLAGLRAPFLVAGAAHVVALFATSRTVGRDAEVSR